MDEPMRQLLPDRDPREIALVARSMFSAVRGIVMLGLEERMVAMPPKLLQKQLTSFLDTHLAGLGVEIALQPGRSP